MQSYTYMQSLNLSTLLPALVAAIPALAPVTDASGNDVAVFTVTQTPTTTTFRVPDSVAQAAVDAVIAAHNPSVLSPAQVQYAADGADLVAFPTRAQVLAALDDITTDLSVLDGSMTLAKAVPILRRTLVNQRAIIRALAVIVRRQSGDG